MKVFTNSSNFVRLAMHVVFFVSMFVGIRLGTDLENAGFLVSPLLALDFVWLAAIIVATFVVSALVLYRIYSKYKLFLADEAKALSLTMKSFLGNFGFGFLLGFICAFAFQSFFMIVFWLIYNL